MVVGGDPGKLNEFYSKCVTVRQSALKTPFAQEIQKVKQETLFLLPVHLSFTKTNQYKYFPNWIFLTQFFNGSMKIYILS